MNCPEDRNFSVPIREAPIPMMFELYGSSFLAVATFATILVVSMFLIHYKPASDLSGIGGSLTEGFSEAVSRSSNSRSLNENFAVASVDPARVPACVERSTEAQALLARFAAIPATDEAVAELRLLISKLCCMEADITAPSAGKYRTLPLQFRTSHDLEPPSTTVGRCLSRSLPQRDIDLAMEKYQSRGNDLIVAILGSDCGGAKQEFAAVLDRLRRAFGTCQAFQPSMDRPVGARDMGFWESRNVGDLSAYQGISASL